MAKSKQTKILPSSIFMTDESRHFDPSPILKTLRAGTGVIFRHYNVPDRGGLAQKLATLCKNRKLPFLVAEDIKLAIAVKADGIHFPKWALSKGLDLKTLNPNWVVTASAHDKNEIKIAETFGVDALLLAPVFRTSSHPGGKTLGPLGFANLAALTPLPVYALGGLTKENINSLPPTRNLVGHAGISIFEK